MIRKIRRKLSINIHKVRRKVDGNESIKAVLCEDEAIRSYEIIIFPHLA